MRGKTRELIQTLEKRIRHGDYVGGGLPSERALSDEFNVTRMTARSALLQLIDNGMLERLPNRRVVVSCRSGNKRGPVGLLVPSITSPIIETWRLRITQVAEEFGAKVRMVMYTHWNDPVINETLAGFEAVFLCPAAEPLPNRVVGILQDYSESLLAIEYDYSQFGIRSIIPFSSTAYRRLFDHLADHGHHHVDCFNVQPIDEVIEGRIHQWNLWRSMRRFDGRLIGNPENAHDLPIERAVAEFGALLDSEDVQGSAVVCTTMPAAVGAVRAMADRGLKAGQDLSICCMNDESYARYTVPSITCLCEPDLRPLLRLCMEWVFDSSRSWIGPMVLSNDAIELFEGESTGMLREV